MATRQGVVASGLQKPAGAKTSSGPRKTPSAHLTTVMQTAKAEEKLEAETFVTSLGPKDSKAYKTSMAGMVHFLKSNVCAEASASRGALREKYHEAYVMHMQKVAKAQKEFQTDKRFASRKVKYVDLLWVNREAFEKLVGKIYATHLIQSARLPVRPCKITGSFHLDHRQYGYPKDWERFTEEDTEAWLLQVTRDAEPDDLQNLHDIISVGNASTSASSSASVDPVVVKQEPLTDEDLQSVFPN